MPILRRGTVQMHSEHLHSYNKAYISKGMVENMNIKKLVALFLAFTLCTGILSTSAFAASGNDSGADLKDYITNSKVLSSLGIFSVDFANKTYTENITREEAIKTALELNGFSNDESKICNLAVSMGFIDSESDYRKAAYLKKDEAAKIFVTLLGYSASAEVKGGYPIGYDMCAKRLGLFDNVDRNSSNVTYADFVNILINSFDVNMNKIANISSDGGIQFKAADNDSILKTVFDIDTIYGLVDENAFSTLLVPADNPTDMLYIDSKAYKINDVGLADLIGHNVKAYVNSDEKILSAVPYDSSELTVFDDDFDAYSANSVTYFDSMNKKKKVRIDSKPYVFYNDVAYAAYTADDINSFNGKLVLVDNDNDNVYEIVKVYDYETVFVGSTAVNDKSVRAKIPSGKFYSFKNIDDDRLTVVTDEGKNVMFTYLLDGDVASIAESKSKTHAKIIISRKTVSGVFESKKVDKYRIDDVEYNASPAIKSELEKYSVGYEIKVALDCFGRIGGIFDSEASGLKYGYIIGVSQKQGLSDNYKIKIFDENEEYKIYNLTDKVRVDGIKIDSEKAVEELKMTETGSARQVVKYGLSGDKVSAIDTARTGSGDRVYDSLKIKKITSSPIDYRPVSYGGSNQLAGVAFVDERDLNGKKWFVVPAVTTENAEKVYAEKKYFMARKYITDQGRLIKKNGDYIEAVDIDDDGYCKYVVYNRLIPENEGSVIGNGMTIVEPQNTYATTVNDIYTVSVDDEIKYGVSLTTTEAYRQNATGTNFYRECICESENILWKAVYDADGNVIEGEHKMIEKGDIVQFKANYQGELNESFVVYDSSLTPLQNAKRLKNYNKLNTNIGYSFGVADKFSLKSTVFLFNNWDYDTGEIDFTNGMQNVYGATQNVMLINKNDTRNPVDFVSNLQVRTYRDFPDNYDYILIEHYFGELKQIFVIREAE